MKTIRTTVTWSMCVVLLVGAAFIANGNVLCIDHNGDTDIERLGVLCCNDSDDCCPGENGSSQSHDHDDCQYGDRAAHVARRIFTIHRCVPPLHAFPRRASVDFVSATIAPAAAGR